MFSVTQTHTEKMEITTQSLSFANLRKPPTCSTSVSQPFFLSTPSLLTYPAVHFFGIKCLLGKPQCKQIKAEQQRKFGAIRASEAEITSTDDVEDVDRWLLEPVGKGYSRHLGSKVPMPDAFQIVSSVVTIGREPEKADMVIPVATVSALHARIQKKEGNLLVTDLGSTNGTFIDDKRLSPGVVATVSPGSCIIFGDANLAKFRVSKLENAEVAEET